MDASNLLPALVGGVLIGLASAGLLYFNGRIAGISGIVGSLLSPSTREERAWRLAFTAGLFGGGLVLLATLPSAFTDVMPRSVPAVIAAGLLVGVGSRLGSGCTSGHGVCGISRLSTRSVIATVTFMTTGIATVLVTRILGGAS